MQYLSNDHIAKAIFPNVQEKIQIGYLLEQEYGDKYYTIYDEKVKDWGLTEMIIGHAYEAILYIRDTSNTTVFNKDA